MQTWAKRGLQTALVTGGLLMLGTGIASADEDVNPDKPASPLDGTATVPAHNNVVGTPLGSHDVPAVQKGVTVRTSELTGAVPTGQATPLATPLTGKVEQAAADRTAPVVDDGRDRATSVTEDARDQADPLADRAKLVGDRLNQLPGGDKLAHANPDEAYLPATDARDGESMSGNHINAIAVLGEAEKVNESSQSYGTDHDVATNGAGGAISGNAVPVPVAVPTKVNGNAAMARGKSVAAAESTVDAVAGATRTARYGVPTSIETSGDPALAAGNIVNPSVSGPVLLCGNVGGAGGTVDATCDISTEADAGGTNRTTGEGGIASGTIAAAPVAPPVEGFGNPVVAVGSATTDATNTADVTSGGDAYTRGHERILSGATASATPAGPIDVLANPIAAVGDASTTTDNTTTTDAGGNSGITGDDSVGGGNLAPVPAATTEEAFGDTAAGAGSTALSVTEDKTVIAGGGNTNDDNGLAASNLVNTPVATAVQGFGNIAQTPTSLPFQFFGNGVTGAGKGSQIAVNELESEAGGNVVSVPPGGTGQVWGETTGEEGMVSGNVVSPQVLPVAQSLATAASGVGGKNSTIATNQTEAESGGDIDTNGDSGFIAGNLVDLPAGAQVQPFGDAVSAIGSSSDAQGLSETNREVGRSSNTSGAGLGSLSGMDVTLPLGVDTPVYDVPVEVLAQAMTELADSGTMEVGAEEPHILLPVSGGMESTEVPRLMRGARGLPSVNPTQGAFSGVLAGMTGLSSVAPAGVPAAAPTEYHTLPAPAAARAGVPAVPAVQVMPSVPVVPSVPAVPSVPSVPAVPAVLPVPAARAGGRDMSAVPVMSSVPAVPAVPATPNFGHVVSPLSAIKPGGFGGRSNTVSPFSTPALGNLTETTAILPVLGDADATTVLPVISAVPVLQQAPTVSPRTDESSLDSTRAALANLFSTHPIG